MRLVLLLIILLALSGCYFAESVKDVGRMARDVETTNRVIRQF